MPDSSLSDSTVTATYSTEGDILIAYYLERLVSAVVFVRTRCLSTPTLRGSRLVFIALNVFVRLQRGPERVLIRSGLPCQPGAYLSVLGWVELQQDFRQITVISLELLFLGLGTATAYQVDNKHHYAHQHYCY